MNNNIDTILTELGWNDGFRIPVANEENKQLEEEIEKKIKLKENLSTKLESTEERIKMMKKHINNLITEKDMNQKLLTAHSTQLKTEDHHYRLSCNTESSLRQEARNFQKEWKEVNEMVLNIEKELQKMTKNIETTKKTLKYDEKALREWEEILNENEDNNELVEQYMKEDLKEYKELELKRQKLSNELQTYRDTITKATNEAREMEIIFSRISTLYDQALIEYRQIFNQWKESVIMLQQRNDDIKKVIQETEALHEISKDKKKILQETEKFWKEQIENNKQVQDSIKKLDKELTMMKEEQNKMKEMINTYENQCLIQKNIMKELTQHVQQVRADIKHKKLQIQIKNTKIEKVNKQITDLTTKLQDINKQKVNIEGKAKELEDMIQEQEKKKSKMSKEMNRLQMANLHIINQIKDLENENKVLKMQYEKETKKCEYLDKLYIKEEQTLENKKEVWYQVEFEVRKSEMKLDRLRGHEYNKSVAEKKQQKIEELQTTLDEKLKVSKLLQKQITTLEDNMRKISNSLASDNNELEYLRNKRQDLVLLMNAGEKQLKAAQNRYEEKQVEESMLRLKVSQMEKIISNIGNNVYDLERYRLELEAAMRERKVEIAVQKESLIIQKRIADGECSEFRNAIAERKIRIKQLQARYDNSTALLGTNPDGTPISTTHIKIQNAQEKYLLQEQGDKLDETIRKTEEEIQAMENTLRVINVCNDKYKVTLTIDDQNKPEVEEHKKLDEQLHYTEHNLKEKKQELQTLTENMQKIQTDYVQILKDIEETQEYKENKNQYLTDLTHQIHEQKQKISRANRSLQIAKKSIHQLFETTEDKTLLIQEKETELRELQEQNSIVLQDIADFTVHHIEVESYIKKLLAVQNIVLPSITLFNQSPESNKSRSNTNLSECLSKRTNRENIIEISSNKVFGGWQKVYSHESYELGCKMNIGIFLPPQIEEGSVPVIYWLSGLTCTEANFIQKAGAQKYASEQGIVLVAPDTSPRNLNIPGEDDDWDFGTGAGFYVDATNEPWKKNYRMYSYVTKELPALINEKFPVLPEKQSIMGHSMGGHGALICALKNPGLYKTVSAFAPISNPISCPWGKKAFSGYLGGTETNVAWKDWDATELAKKYNGPPLDILVDQGKEDKFLKDDQLLPENLLSAAKDAGLSLVLRFQEGYDHSYFFISTFIEDHIKHHVKYLKS
ncbi:PREDICTED: coiled-coil domain-containing protein 39 isoform X1 [Eufriesea mexicana]|uniref:coiled-coil domain-containing protein 39 isoform X1 n=1 Tax=Eufriesea mexicana TaxID=516756 RepID=UPI00083BC0A6|nr:PREDICTED: coiled-coil domain-containing protein 39 isoform X1 [Eufriesea mexicana]